MKNAVTKVEEKVPAYVGSNLPITQSDFDILKDQRRMLMEYVSGQLVKDVDYGVIPGVKKSSLFKPGAEKLLRLFGLGIRVSKISQELDRQNNFALVEYKAEVFHMATGNVVAECEGSCNSQEKKYKERKVYVKGREPITEATPVCDILNTLQKMSQKRAMVGAVILAVAASDFFTQDFDDPEDARSAGAVTGDQTEKCTSPTVTKVSTKVQQNVQAGSEEIPNCELCGTLMRISQSGSSYWCPNFKDGKGEHSRIERKT